MNRNVKEKILNLPKRNDELNIDDLKVKVNDCYEKESTYKSATAIGVEKTDDGPTLKSNIKSDSSVIIVDAYEDDVFVEGQTTDKQASKEDLKNRNLRMLAQLNRRSRNTSSRTSSLSLNSRQTNKRLMNSSFK